ncbi:ATP-grasp domain-containing protein [Ureibacillus acetophenoni]|uniref:RimK-like ATP-grasp domain-containing protein n=1 Tax=Ureibacillus acetophenoni TaxID=614649 RepID=A0A285UHY0_9BACL|nr:hypothetical protein [Ureibacillus acetophenoni]SOC41490.1 RimK-like ATP-grasp domain-containing protein [Ureibacillus acetophenoni]
MPHQLMLPDFNLLSDEELFKNVMQDTATELGLTMEFLYDGWIVRFTNPYDPSKRYELLGYDIGLNSSQSSFIAKDKAMCFHYLLEAGVPAIEHFLLKPKDYKYSNEDAKVTLAKVKSHYHFPFVVKQNNGGGGKNICFVADDSDLTFAIAEFSSENLEISISPYYDFPIEYRCTYLDGEVLMSYGKTKGENLQNNLSKGARVVEVPEHLKEELHAIAIKAGKAVGLRFGNIDIVETNKGLMVLEVNASVAQKRVARYSPELYHQSVNVYVTALRKLIDLG